MLPAEDAMQALIYLDAAERVLGPDRSSGDHGLLFTHDLPMIGPSGLLVAHAVEIALNAYLSAFGVKTGKWATNHDLEARLSSLDEKLDPMVADAAFRKYVKAINPAHKSGQFRYARSYQEPFVSARSAIGMVRPTIERIHSIVGEKIYGHPVQSPLLSIAPAGEDSHNLQPDSDGG